METDTDLARGVSEAFGVPLDALITRSDRAPRRAPMCVAWPRWVYWYLLREYTELPYTAIGRALGYDHSSICHGVKRVQLRLAEDATFAELVRAAADCDREASVAVLRGEIEGRVRRIRALESALWRIDPRHPLLTRDRSYV